MYNMYICRKKTETKRRELTYLFVKMFRF